ncbi:MAG TPA: ceramidase domain-containing protein [Candidatus Saccharimonadales bacterium]|nr:ceramidase domain-containing protein [Candidatus Saccharimonadales bacterium]
MAWAKPTIQYCENSLSGWIAQPANAFSSLLISFAGIYILRQRRHQYSAPLGWAAILLGISSAVYYATDTFAGQLADLGGMFLLASLMIAAGLRVKKLWPTLITGAGVPIILTAIFRTVGNFNIGIPLFTILLATALYFELRLKTKKRFYALAFAAFAAGFIFWWLDYKRIWCSPGSSHYINGHAVWHIFNAVALLMLDKYYSLRPS